MAQAQFTPIVLAASWQKPPPEGRVDQNPVLTPGRIRSRPPMVRRQRIHLESQQVQVMGTTNRLLIHSIRDVTIVTFQEISILDTLQVEEIGGELYELVDNKACKKIILDFANVRFLSSSALGVLLTLRKKAAAIKGQILLCSLRDDLRKLFRITRLEKLFEFCTDEKEALSTFGVTSVG